MPEGPVTGGTYSVELLYERAPSLDERVVAAVKASRPGAEVVRSGPIVAFHHDVPVQGEIPAQTAILGTEETYDPETLALDLQQTWDWPEAATAAVRARSSVLVTDLLSSSLDRVVRLRIFLEVLSACVQATDPIALRWQPANKLVSPTDLLEVMRAADPTRMARLALNVRLFDVPERPDEIVMDTRGLAEFVLPDLQVHFRELEPTAIARVLYRSALYVWAEGDIIDDGSTIEGLLPSERWRCRHERALVGPDRTVLDVEPGPPFAAGHRG